MSEQERLPGDGFSPKTSAIVNEAYDDLISAYASAMLAANDDGSTPENLATFVQHAEKAYGLIADISPEHENPTVTLLLMAGVALERARELVKSPV